MARGCVRTQQPGRRSWLLALALAAALHLAVFAKYVPPAQQGAEAKGREGIVIGLKQLQPAHSQAQSKSPHPVREKVRPQPESASVPEQAVAPESVPELSAEPAQVQSHAADVPVAGGGSPELEVVYAQQLLAWLERYKRYPRAARRRGEEGEITLRFVINASGELQSYAFLESSPYRRLNTAAEDMLKRASPFPAVPQDLRQGQTRFAYTVPVVFALRR